MWRSMAYSRGEHEENELPHLFKRHGQWYFWAAPDPLFEPCNVLAEAWCEARRTR